MCKIDDYPLRIYKYKSGDFEEWVAEYPDLEGCIGVGKRKKKQLMKQKLIRKFGLKPQGRLGSIFLFQVKYFQMILAVNLI